MGLPPPPASAPPSIDEDHVSDYFGGDQAMTEIFLRVLQSDLSSGTALAVRLLPFCQHAGRWGFGGACDAPPLQQRVPTCFLFVLCQQRYQACDKFPPLFFLLFPPLPPMFLHPQGIAKKYFNGNVQTARGFCELGESFPGCCRVAGLVQTLI